jgi:hypothetical protein
VHSIDIARPEDSNKTKVPITSLNESSSRRRPGTYFTISIAADLEDSERCLQSWNAWSSSDINPPLEFIASTRYPITAIYETWQPVGDGGVYTIPCDGIPRYSFHSPPTTSTSRLVTVTATQSHFVVRRGSAAIPHPICQASSDYCREAFKNRKGKQLIRSDNDTVARNFKAAPEFGPCSFMIQLDEEPELYNCDLQHESEIMLFY